MAIQDVRVNGLMIKVYVEGFFSMFALKLQLKFAANPNMQQKRFGISCESSAGP